jgi:hypothetical protein
VVVGPSLPISWFDFNPPFKTSAGAPRTRPKAGFYYRRLDRRRAIQRLNRIDAGRIVALIALYASHRPSDRDHSEEISSAPDVLLIDGRDIWGIPAPKPRI